MKVAPDVGGGQSVVLVAKICVVVVLEVAVRRDTKPAGPLVVEVVAAVRRSSIGVRATSGLTDDATVGIIPRRFTPVGGGIDGERISVEAHV